MGGTTEEPMRLLLFLFLIVAQSPAARQLLNLSLVAYGVIAVAGFVILAIEIPRAERIR